jgi:Ni/Fe-hydrogenase 1 B-type cytochrome subunit
MVLLVLTGLFIASPFGFPGLTMGAVLWVHFVCMYLVLIVLAARVYWAFFGKGSSLTRGSRIVGADYRNFLPQEENRGQLWETLKYYVFLRKTRPATAKFDSFEKSAYVFWMFLLVAQAYTGFAIYGPTYAWPLFSTGTALVGGLGAMRNIHYLIMWVFIITTVAHVYLAAAENVADLPLILWWRERPPQAGATADSADDSGGPPEETADIADETAEAAD